MQILYYAQIAYEYSGLKFYLSNAPYLSETIISNIYKTGLESSFTLATGNDVHYIYGNNPATRTIGRDGMLITLQPLYLIYNSFASSEAKMINSGTKLPYSDTDLVAAIARTTCKTSIIYPNYNDYSHFINNFSNNSDYGIKEVEIRTSLENQIRQANILCDFPAMLSNPVSNARHDLKLDHINVFAFMHDHNNPFWYIEALTGGYIRMKVGDIFGDQIKKTIKLYNPVNTVSLAMENTFYNNILGIKINFTSSNNFADKLNFADQNNQTIIFKSCLFISNIVSNTLNEIVMSYVFSPIVRISYKVSTNLFFSKPKDFIEAASNIEKNIFNYIDKLDNNHQALKTIKELTSFTIEHSEIYIYNFAENIIPIIQNIGLVIVGAYIAHDAYRVAENMYKTYYISGDQNATDIQEL